MLNELYGNLRAADSKNIPCSHIIVCTLLFQRLLIIKVIYWPVYNLFYKLDSFLMDRHYNLKESGKLLSLYNVFYKFFGNWLEGEFADNFIVTFDIRNTGMEIWSVDPKDHSNKSRESGDWLKTGIE